MHNPYIEFNLPKLRPGHYSVESPKDPRYNCIAWAIGDNTQWWENRPGPGVYWPSTVQDGYTLESWIELFRTVGYREAQDDSLEVEFEKIAIYVDSDESPTHVARQNSSGVWMSKLGKGHDIEHNSLEVLEGTSRWEYGSVACILKRPRYKMNWWKKLLLRFGVLGDSPLFRSCPPLPKVKPK